jgi:hypothetical protein
MGWFALLMELLQKLFFIKKGSSSDDTEKP